LAVDSSDCQIGGCRNVSLGQGRSSGRSVDFRLDFAKVSAGGAPLASGRRPLTRRQREIYDFVRDFVAEHGYSPSLEEIGAHFGLSSVATVHKHVQHLSEKGYLRKAWNRSRSIEPLDDAPAGAVDLPLLGSVAAGAPIEAIEEDERIAVPRELVRRRGETFVLRVRGDSMIEEQTWWWSRAAARRGPARPSSPWCAARRRRSSASSAAARR
jgi:hypothetical protein